MPNLIFSKNVRLPSAATLLRALRVKKWSSTKSNLCAVSRQLWYRRPKHIIQVNQDEPKNLFTINWKLIFFIRFSSSFFKIPFNWKNLFVDICIAEYKVSMLMQKLLSHRDVAVFASFSLCMEWWEMTTANNKERKLKLKSGKWKCEWKIFIRMHVFNLNYSLDIFSRR